MGAPKGHPPYRNAAGELPGGRPVEWTEERIDAEADALLEWIKNKKNIWLKDFALERDYDASCLSRFAKNNKRFAQAYKKAISNQESLIVKGGLSNSNNVTMSIFVLKCNHKWLEGNETFGMEEEEESRSAKAIRETKAVCIEHADAIEQASDKPSEI